MAPKPKGKDAGASSKAPAFVSPWTAHCNAANAQSKALKKLCKGGPAKLEVNAPTIIQSFANHNLNVVVEPPAQKFRCPMDRDIRKAAVAALAKLPVTALVSHVEALIAKLEDPEDVVRTAAVTVLAGPKSPPSLPDSLLAHGQAISAHFANPDKGVRDAALAVWSRLPLCTDKFGLLKCAQEAVVPLLDDPSGGVREAAMNAIRKLDVASRSQLAAAIVKRLEDADGDVRAAASAAILDLSHDVLAPYASSVLDKLGADDCRNDDDVAERVRLLHMQNPLLFKVATEPPPSPPRRQPKAQDASDS